MPQSVSRDDGVGLSVTMPSYETSNSSTPRSGPHERISQMSDYGQTQYSQQSSGMHTLTRSVDYRMNCVCVHACVCV